jgi:hypothetical protein
MRARLLPEATTSSNSRKVSSESGSLEKRCGQYPRDLVPIRTDSMCPRSGSSSGSI